MIGESSKSMWEPRAVRVAAVTLSCALTAILAGAARADVDCSTADDRVNSARLPHRMAAVMEVLEAKCEPLPASIRTALETQRWADNVPISTAKRIEILQTAIANGYGEAIDLAVSVLETGIWPEGLALQPDDGAAVILGLRPALDPYRIRLLLDVYEQVPSPAVQLAVVETLRHADSPEAMLPILDAYWHGLSNEVKVAAAAAVAAQPEGEVKALLTRVTRDLPKGPALDWALKMAKNHDVPDATRAGTGKQ